MKDHIDDAAVFFDLEWDTEFFGVKCAKAILYKHLTNEQWDKLKTLSHGYQFISIENRDSEPVNAQFVGKEQNIFLADVNIQFSKILDGSSIKPETVIIREAIEKDDQILKIAEFKYSKFIEDPEFKKRGGDQVYYQWILNSFEKPGKVYALSKDKNNDINGFLLHSYSGDICTVELMAVSKDAVLRGIGTNLFTAVEYSSYRKGYKKINVGTQVRNEIAVNFYHRVGCRQSGCHQVYHLWKL